MVGGESLGQNPIETLSNRELEVFDMIGQGLSTKQIANKLHLSHKTIETHREKIKTKLNLANANELSHRAVQWVLGAALSRVKRRVRACRSTPSPPLPQAGAPDCPHPRPLSRKRERGEWRRR